MDRHMDRYLNRRLPLSPPLVPNPLLLKRANLARGLRKLISQRRINAPANAVVAGHRRDEETQQSRKLKNLRCQRQARLDAPTEAASAHAVAASPDLPLLSARERARLVQRVLPDGMLEAVLGDPLGNAATALADVEDKMVIGPLYRPQVHAVSRRRDRLDDRRRTRSVEPRVWAFERHRVKRIGFHESVSRA